MSPKYLSFILLMGIAARIQAKLEFGNDTNEALQTCINKIIKDYCRKNDVVVALNVSFQLDFPTIRYSTYYSFRHHINVNFYVIAATYVDIFNHTFNSRAKFLVITAKFDRTWFEYFVQIFALKVIIIQIEDLQLFTYFPYKYGDVDMPNLDVVALGPYPKKHLFRNRHPVNWKNSTIHVSYKPFIPYVMEPEGKLKGMEVIVLEVVRDHFLFEIEWIEANSTWFDPNIPGSLEQAYGHIIRREVDIAIGAYYLKACEEKYLDVSFAYFQDGVHWVVKKARILEQWKRIILAFAPKTWLAFLSTLIIFTLLYTFYLKKLQKYLVIFYYFFAILVEAAVALPKKLTIRGLLLTWILYSMIVSTAFKSQMMNILSGDAYEYQISSLAEIIDNKLTIKLNKDLANLYDNKNEDEHYVFENFIQCPNESKCLEEVSLSPKIATTGTRRNLNYRLSEFIDSDGQVLIHVLDQTALPMNFHMLFTKGFPLYELINKQIMLMAENGCINKHLNAFEHLSLLDFFIKLSKLVDNNRRNNDAKEMSLSFILLGFGLAISVIVLVFEVALFEVYKRKNGPKFEFLE